MGVFSSLFQKEKDPEQTVQAEYEEPVKRQPMGGGAGKLTENMKIDVAAKDGSFLLSGRVTLLEDETITLGRLPGELSFPILPLNSDVSLNGYDRRMLPISLTGVVELSNRTILRVKDIKTATHNESREAFRLPLSAPVSLYRQDDEHYRRPEDCQLVNISTGGCCVESEYVHIEDEVVRVRVKLEEYSPLNFLGQIVRCSEHRSGKYWYGILFAQLTEQEITALNKTLYNLQMGIKETRIRSSEDDHW